MGRRVNTVAATIGAGALLIVLVGCAFTPTPVVTRLPTDGAAGTPVATTAPAPAPTATVVTLPPTAAPPTAEPPAATGDCGGMPVTLTAGSASFTISGDCPEVQVDGSALTIDASAAQIGALTISGDRIVLVAGATGGLIVQGNDVVVDADAVGTVVLRGDRNVITAVADIGSAQFDGNDNAVRAGSGVGSVVDNGARNAVG